LRNFSHYLAGVIHGDQFVILDQFSKARASRFDMCVFDTASCLTNLQAWDRFLYVYKDLIKNLTNLSLEKDPEEEAEALANQKAGSSVNSGIPSGNRMLIVKCVWSFLNVFLFYFVLQVLES
jgi:hypothetical protein